MLVAGPPVLPGKCVFVFVFLPSPQMAFPSSGRRLTSPQRPSSRGHRDARLGGPHSPGSARAAGAFERASGQASQGGLPGPGSTRPSGGRKLRTGQPGDGTGLEDSGGAEGARVRAPVSVKAKLAGRGDRERFLWEAQTVGGARWARSSQLVAFEASATAAGEGQHGGAGGRPGRGGGGRGPATRTAAQHVARSRKHGTAVGATSTQPGSPPARGLSDSGRRGSPAARGQSGSSRCFPRERPRPSRDPASGRAAPRARSAAGKDREGPAA